MKECWRKTQEKTALALGGMGGAVTKGLDLGHRSGKSAMGSFEDGRVASPPELTWQALGVVD